MSNNLTANEPRLHEKVKISYAASFFHLFLHVLVGVFWSVGETCNFVITQHRKSSYLYNRDPFTCKTASLYWHVPSPLQPVAFSCQILLCKKLPRRQDRLNYTNYFYDSKWYTYVHKTNRVKKTYPLRLTQEICRSRMQNMHSLLCFELWHNFV